MAHTQNVDEFVSDLEQIGDVVGRPAEVPASAAGPPWPQASGVASGRVLPQGNRDPWFQYGDPWTHVMAGQFQGQTVPQSYFNGA